MIHPSAAGAAASSGRCAARQAGALPGAALLAVALLLGGCQGNQLRPDPAYAPARPVPVPVAPQQADGAIYRSGWEMRLFEDTRARRVGDILTVQLTEQTSASKSSATSTTRASNLSMANPTLLGTTPVFGVPSFLPLASTRNNTLELQQSSSQDFEGEGESTQSNSLSGNISVTVVEVLPNGNLVVRGEKLLNLNRGQEHLRLSGIVRAADVTDDNTVPSTRLADVRISFSGEGEVADASTLGWLSRFFVSKVWPF